MKSIFSGALIATAIVACLSLNVQANTVKPVHTIAVTDTGKMKMAKMNKKMDKKMSKMAADTSKMAKKMDNKMNKKMDKKMSKKMAKDTASKM